MNIKANMRVVDFDSIKNTSTVAYRMGRNRRDF